jgi:hypothetical protein
MRLRHIDTFDFGNIQHFKFPTAGITLFGFLLDSGFFSSRTGSRTASAACIIRFCWHCFTAFRSGSFITLLISPFLRTLPRAVARLIGHRD